MKDCWTVWYQMYLVYYFSFIHKSLSKLALFELDIPSLSHLEPVWNFYHSKGNSLKNLNNITLSCGNMRLFRNEPPMPHTQILPSLPAPLMTSWDHVTLPQSRDRITWFEFCARPLHAMTVWHVPIICLTELYSTYHESGLERVGTECSIQGQGSVLAQVRVD